MPIVSLEGHEAVKTRKENEYAHWGSRNEENRVEPITSPAFKVPFKLKQKEPIFTIGSCFARNVERELQDRGFRIPIRDLFKTPEFKDLPFEIVNNFGTPSIYNEMAWAFGEKEFDFEANIIEVGDGKFSDLHMVNSIRPTDRETVVTRRKGLMNATRTLAECRVIIMTLGLVELWWDKQTESYLNTAPLPSILKRWPERFALHVLSFEECYDYLRRALDLAFANGRKDLSLILTVSPVPMMATHRNVDVITANSYSKSVLRAVAEHLVTQDDRVTYFPSYETVSLSDRRFSWMDDFVHVRESMIALNVERMVDAFTGAKMRSTYTIPDLGRETGESQDALMLAEQARQARLDGNIKFFEKHGGAAQTSPAFAIEYARLLFDIQKFEETIRLTQNDDRVEMQTLRARSVIALGRIAEARDVIRPVCLGNPKGKPHWLAYLETAVAARSVPAILEVEKDWERTDPRSAGLRQMHVGRALRSLGEERLASERLLSAAKLPDRSVATAIECASSLVALKRFAAAGSILRGLSGNTDWQNKRIKQLRLKIRRGTR